MYWLSEQEEETKNMAKEHELSSKEVTMICLKENIRPFYLPAYTTKVMMPLDQEPNNAADRLWQQERRDAKEFLAPLPLPLSLSLSFSCSPSPPPPPTPPTSRKTYCRICKEYYS